MERSLFNIIRSEPFFSDAYLNALIELKENKYLCLKTLAKGLKTNFDVKIAGVIQPEGVGKWHALFSIPKESGFEVWLKNDNVQEAINKQIKYSPDGWMLDKQDIIGANECNIIDNGIIAIKIPEGVK